MVGIFMPWRSVETIDQPPTPRPPRPLENIYQNTAGWEYIFFLLVLSQSLITYGVVYLYSSESVCGYESRSGLNK